MRFEDTGMQRNSQNNDCKKKTNKLQIMSNNLHR